MTVHLVPSGRESLSVSFGFARLLSDLVRARTTFVDAIVRRFGDLVTVSSEDFSFNDGSQQGDFRCRFRILGKGQAIVLTPDGLTLTLDNCAPFDANAVKQFLDRLSRTIESDFDQHEVPRVTASFQQHFDTAAPDDASRYMSRFLDSQVSSGVRDLGIEGVEYRPGFRIVLRGQHWDIRRTIELSEQIPGGLFVGTDLVVLGSPASSLAGFQDHLYVLLSLADRATGLVYGEGV